jgi:hypothetical protein
VLHIGYSTPSPESLQNTRVRPQASALPTSITGSSDMAQAVDRRAIGMPRQLLVTPSSAPCHSIPVASRPRSPISEASPTIISENQVEVAMDSASESPTATNDTPGDAARKRDCALADKSANIALQLSPKRLKIYPTPSPRTPSRTQSALAPIPSNRRGQRIRVHSESPRGSGRVRRLTQRAEESGLFELVRGL